MLKTAISILVLFQFLTSVQAHFCLLYPPSREKAIWPNSNARFWPIIPPLRDGGKPCEQLQRGPKTAVASGRLTATFEIGNGASHVVSWFRCYFFYVGGRFVCWASSCSCFPCLACLLPSFLLKHFIHVSTKCGFVIPSYSCFRFYLTSKINSKGPMFRRNLRPQHQTKTRIYRWTKQLRLQRSSIRHHHSIESTL